MSDMIFDTLDMIGLQSPGAQVLKWIVHATFLIAAAMVASRLAARRSADCRHSIWICAYVGLAAVAVQSSTWHPINVSVPVERSIQSAGRAGWVADSSLDRHGAMIPIDLGADTTRRPPTAVTAPFDSPTTDQGATLDSITATLEASEADTPVLTSLPADTSSSRGWLFRTVVVVYFLGLGIGIARTFLSWSHLSRIVKQSDLLSMEQMQLADVCAAKLQLGTTPSCRVSTSTDTPFTFGAFRPFVIIPSHFGTLSVDQRCHCLLHEMAHVSHRDAWWNWLVEITTAVYWFHPLAHMARLAYRRAREDAADDAVLRCGESPVAYSRSLVEVTHASALGRNSLSIAIASEASLETRVRRVLRPGLRIEKSPRWLVPLLVSAFVTASSIGIGQRDVVAQVTQSPRKSPVEVEERESPEAVAPKGTDDVGLFAQFQSAKVYARSPDQVSTLVDIDFEGQVTDESGAVEDAIVLIREFVSISGMGRRHIAPPIVAKTSTDPNGRYHVHGIELAMKKSIGRARWEVLVADKQGRLGLGVYVLTTNEIRKGMPWKATVDVTLQGDDAIAGQIVTNAEKPLSGVRVAVKEITESPKAATGDDPFRGDPFLSRRLGAFPPEPHVYRFPTTDLNLVVETDSDGRFAISVPHAASMVLGLRRDGFAPKLVRVSQPGFQRDLMSSFVNPELGSPATIELQELLKIAVSVFNDRGDRIHDFRVEIVPARGPNASRTLQPSDDGIISTTAETLTKSADNAGMVRLNIRFPIESELLPISTSVPVANTIAQPELSFSARQGIRISGRVISKADSTGIKNARIYWHQDPQRIVDTLFACDSETDGEWAMVVPRGPGFVSVVGQSAGLDLWTVERFNQAQSGQERFTRAVKDGSASDLQIAEFRIDPIETRMVTVIDAGGLPVAGIWVHASCIQTQVVEGKTYRLNQNLAEPVMTDENGQCSLTLNRSVWEHGTVKVTKSNDQEFASSPGYTAAQATITPGSNSPLHLKLGNPWEVTGRVLIDGRPASGSQVGLVTMHDDGSSEFSWLAAGLERVDENGQFKLYCTAGPEYFFMLRHGDDSAPKFYLAKDPISKVSAERYTTGTVSISGDQLKTARQRRDDAERAKKSSPE